MIDFTVFNAVMNECCLYLLIFFSKGDGTAFIFQNRPDIFTLSLHCQNNFPLRKQESDLDVGLDVGLGDTGYMRILSVSRLFSL